MRRPASVHLVFALAGGCVATFGSRLPDIKHTLGLTPGALGLVLLSIALGSLIGLPASGWFCTRLGTAAVVRIGVVLVVAAEVVAALAIDAAGSPLLLGCGWFFLGLGIGLWDVAMNLEGAETEREEGRSLMPRFHASFSVGTVAAALLGAGMSAARVPVGVHLVLVTLLCALTAHWTLRGFSAGPEERDHDAPAPRSAWGEPRVVLLGLMVLTAAFTEGTANDWMAVAMVDGHALPAWAGVLGFATFLSFMTAGRVLGTHLLDRHGRIVVLRVLFTLAAAGSLLVIFGNATLAFVGAAVWGVGASLGFPVGMSAAADDPARAAARVSVVSTLGYVAFLAGPPLLGFLGDHVGVLRALLVVSVALIAAQLVVPAAREPHRVVSNA